MFHLDTVWPLGTLASMPWGEEGDILRGPGVYDMKASAAIALAALRGMRANNVRPVRPVRLLFTSDEEIGSAAARPVLEAEARKAALVLCMEPAWSTGALKTARKGVGEYYVTAYGKASHAGSDHKAGINAIEELAHQVIAIQKLTDYARGVTFNVGTITGGTASNIVPDKATLEVDFRIEHLADAEWVGQQMASLRPVLSGARLDVRGGLNRPPMERTPQIVEVFQKAQAIAAQLGIDLQEVATGGGSDANFTAALAPTLDGLGAIGDGAHAPEEHILASSLPQRAALLTAILTQW
jgi:glutamate carboxypeptidase